MARIEKGYNTMKDLVVEVAKDNTIREEALEDLRMRYAENEMPDVLDNLNFEDEMDLINAYRIKKGEAEIMELNRENFNSVCHSWTPWEVLEALNDGDFDPEDGYFYNDDYSGLATCDDIWFEDSEEDVIEALISGELEPTCYELDEALRTLQEMEEELAAHYSYKKCMEEMAQKFQEVIDIYEKFYPKGDYLTFYAYKKEGADKMVFDFNNRYWEGGEDANFPIRYKNQDEEDN